MINCYVVSKRFFLKREELSDARAVSITKKKYDSAVDIKIYQVLKVNIGWMINYNLFKFFFVLDLHNKIVCWI